MSNVKDFFLVLLISSLVIISIISMVGAVYKDLRFIADHKIVNSRVTKCICNSYFQTYHNSSPFEGPMTIEHVKYTLSFDEFNNSITKIGGNPAYDWCQFKGKEVQIYYFSKLQRAEIFENQNKQYNLLEIFFLMASLDTIYGTFFLGIIFFINILFGFKQLSKIAKKIHKDIEFPSNFKQKKKSLTSRILDLFNKIVIPLVSLILAIIINIFLVLILMKGMLYVESSNDFSNGLMVVTGAFILSSCPALILQLVYSVKISKKRIILFIKNLIVLFLTFKLTHNSIAIFLDFDFRSLEKETIIKFLMEIIALLFA